MKPFQKAQLDFIDYLRKPEADVKIEKQKSRQQEFYRDLIYKNINQCIADVFPITKNIVAEPDWQIMIRDFISTHRLQTPYFLEICQEFLVYLIHTRKPLVTDYPFMVELAHFEWIQLALDISNADMNDVDFPESQYHSAPSENSLWKASPLLVCLTYSFPVHIIDECYLPTEKNTSPTYLLVYRDRKDDIKILETDNLSMRIIQLLQVHENINQPQIFQLLSAELDNHQKEIMQARILPVLSWLAENEIVFCSQT